MVLGGLLKALISQGLQPLPSPPFTGLSFKNLASNFDKMSLPTLCGVTFKRRCARCYDEDVLSCYDEDAVSCSPYGMEKTKCEIKKTINDRISLVEQGLQGLELE